MFSLGWLDGAWLAARDEYCFLSAIIRQTTFSIFGLTAGCDGTFGNTWNVCDPSNISGTWSLFVRYANKPWEILQSAYSYSRSSKRR